MSLHWLLTNKILMSCLCGNLTAQIVKNIVDFIHKEFSIKGFFDTGDMPSAHTALVTSLCLSIGIVKGSSSAAFAISLVLAGIVIEDAMGVRYATGRNTEIINQMRHRDIQEGIAPATDHDLKVVKGHRPLEVLAGAVIGVGMTLLVCYVL